MHGKKEEAVRDAVAFIGEETPQGGSGKVEGFFADVSSLAGMNKLCDEVLASTGRLDCLINNAGSATQGEGGMLIFYMP